MNAKDITAYFIQQFALSGVNWARQASLAKKLLKLYNGTEIKYAIDYYKNNGTEVYSLGFLLYGSNMEAPMKQLTAEKHINKQECVDSGERNRNKIRQYSEAQRREEYPLYLFTESREDN